MDNYPKVTVIMSVFNNEKTIASSIESILSQTYENISILVLDDASTDSTLQILKNFEKENLNIKILENNLNLGLTKSLNILIKTCNSDYIARHDGDDISHPRRIEIQMKEIIKHELDFVSSRAISFDGKRILPGWTFYLPYRFLLRYKNPFIHGTLLIKRESLRSVDFYDENYLYAQDYKLMCDLLHLKCKYRVIKKPLYTLNLENNISSIFKKEQELFATKARKAYTGRR